MSPRDSGQVTHGGDGVNETKQRDAIEMTGMVSRRSHQRPQSIDLDEDGMAEMAEGRVWSFSQTGTAKERPRDFQMVNPLHAPRQDDEAGGGGGDDM